MVTSISQTTASTQAQAAPKAVAGPPPAPRQESRPAQAQPAQANGPKQPVSAKASAKSNDEEWWTE